MVWNIVPPDAAGPLRIGMTARQVGALLDDAHPVSRRLNYEDGSTREFRGVDFPICHYMEDIFFMIDLHSDVLGVTIFGEEVYEEEPRRLLQVLEERNGGAKVGLGTVLFENICVSTLGFYYDKEKSFFDANSGEQDDRDIGIFRKGYYDQWLHVYKEITFF